MTRESDRSQRVFAERAHWNVAVVLHRESVADTQRTLDAIDEAVSGRSVFIDLLVNGKPTLAQGLARHLGERPMVSSAGTVVRLWSIEVGDKAHAWNEYFHRIWCGQGPAFFVDGYARVHPQAFDRLVSGFLVAPHALAAAGVPTAGPSANRLREQMLRHGGLHGNLFVLAEATLNRLRVARFRLPVGLYRTDAVLGAALSFGLDPSRFDWNPRANIVVVPGASWDIDAAPWWRWSTVRDWGKRRLRQAQGVMENRAVRDCLAIRKQPISALPSTAVGLVHDWRARRGREFRALMWRRPLVALAWRRMQRAQPVHLSGTAPLLVTERRGTVQQAPILNELGELHPR